MWNTVRAQKTTAQPPISSLAADDTDVSVRIRDVSKMYRIYNRPPDRLKEMLFSRFGKHYGREFWALRQLSVDLHRGESLAIIGRNGSGKSTLLQMIAGTLAPTTGQIQVRGRVAALLELGGGFNPQFTGRENVFLKGAILGLSRQEIARRFDEIAAFADIGDFIEQPVKLYSSGMYIRLAFAVATCVDPEVLLVDEALAVGDVFFRQKCYRRLEEMREKGMALVLVTHSMPDVEQYCKHALLLDRGRMAFYGDASEAVKRYYLMEQEGRALPATSPRKDNSSINGDWGGASVEWPDANAFIDLSRVAQVSNGWARCTGVAICDDRGRRCRSFQQGQTLSLFYEFEMLRDIEVPIGGVVMKNDKDIIVHGKNTLQYASQVPPAVPQGSVLRFRQDIVLDIAVGEYSFEVGLATIGRDAYELRTMMTSGELHHRIARICHLPAAGTFAVLPRKDDTVRPPHHGLANLPGECMVTLSLPKTMHTPEKEAII
jgi:ABC-type polysaccharide/polyol phosphate transport system ATPase subunit